MKKRLPVDPDDYAVHYRPRTHWLTFVRGWVARLFWW